MKAYCLSYFQPVSNLHVTMFYYQGHKSGSPKSKIDLTSSINHSYNTAIQVYSKISIAKLMTSFHQTHLVSKTTYILNSHHDLVTCPSKIS